MPEYYLKSNHGRFFKHPSYLFIIILYDAIIVWATDGANKENKIKIRIFQYKVDLQPDYAIFIFLEKLRNM
jgi:hypothetical protein